VGQWTGEGGRAIIYLDLELVALEGEVLGEEVVGRLAAEKLNVASGERSRVVVVSFVGLGGKEDERGEWNIVSPKSSALRHKLPDMAQFVESSDWYVQVAPRGRGSLEGSHCN